MKIPYGYVLEAILQTETVKILMPQSAGCWVISL